MIPSPALVWAALGVVYVVWGSTYLAIRVMVEDVPPLLGAGARFAFAGAAMLVVLAARGRSVGLTRRTAAGSALVGLLLPAGGNGLVTVAERDVPSGLAALLIATVPLWVVVLRTLAGRERVARRTLLGVLVGLAGLALLLAPGARPAEATTLGIVLLLVAAASWALGSFVSPSLGLPDDLLVATAWQMLFGGAALLAGAAIAGEAPPAGVGTDAALAFAWLVVAGSWLAYSAYAWLLRHVPVSRVATYAYVNPVVAVLLGWAVLGERLSAPTLVGAGIVVASVVLVVSRERVRARPAARTASSARPASASS